MTSITKKLDNLADQIATLESERSAPALAQASRAEIESKLRGQIESWHDAGAHAAAGALQDMVEGSGATLMLPSPRANVHHGSVVDLAAHARSVRALLTFAIGKEAMFARFEPMLDEMPEGLDAEARSIRRADLDRRLIELEVREEALLREAEAQGIVRDPRPGQRAEAAILIGYGVTSA